MMSFCRAPNLGASVSLVGCAAKTLPTTEINDLEEHQCFFDDSGMLSMTSFCRASNPASLSVFGRVHDENFTDDENQRSRGT